EGLTPADADEITAHVETCTDCQQTLDALLPHGPRAGSSPTPPANFLERLLQIKPTLPTLPPAEEQAPSEDTTLSPTAGEGLASTGSPVPPHAGSPLPWPTVPGYLIHKELGRGGMGVVYQARQLKANRLVALKMILASRQASLEERVRFQIEAEAVAGFQH